MTEEELQALVDQWMRRITAAWLAQVGSLSAIPAVLPAELLQLIAQAQIEIISALQRFVALPRSIATDLGGIFDFRAGKIRDNLQPAALTVGGFKHVAAALAQPAMAIDGVNGRVADAEHEQQSRQAHEEAALHGDGWGVMWVARRDCCRLCLAYSGLIVPVGGMFRGGLSFDPASRNPAAGLILGPPLHPNDRCHLEVVHVDSSKKASDALKREALRSGVKGWALESESEKSRRRTAQALLHRHLGLPKSVLEEARRRLASSKPFRRSPP